jgi:hypothetical protein
VEGFGFSMGWYGWEMALTHGCGDGAICIEIMSRNNRSIKKLEGVW